MIDSRLLHAALDASDDPLGCGPQKVCSISRGDLLQPIFVVQSAEHLLNSYPTIRRQFVSGMLRTWPSPSSRLWNSRTKTGMRASAIVMHNPFPQNSPQMLFVQREASPGTRASCFRSIVHSRHSPSAPARGFVEFSARRPPTRH